VAVEVAVAVPAAAVEVAVAVPAAAVEVEVAVAVLSAAVEVAVAVPAAAVEVAVGLAIAPAVARGAEAARALPQPVARLKSGENLMAHQPAAYRRAMAAVAARRPVAAGAPVAAACAAELDHVAGRQVAALPSCVRRCSSAPPRAQKGRSSSRAS
jgi:hypothetical protein